MRPLLAWTACVFALAACGGDGDRDVTVVFRYDDYSAKSDTAFERALIELFRRHDLPVSIGVIPSIARNISRPTPDTPQFLRPLPEEKFALLREAMSDGTVEVALHGLSHQRLDPDQRTEFSGRTYEDQVERISRGKRFLEEGLDVPIRVFIPPWNSFDAATIRALETLEFEVLSSDLTRSGRDVGTLAHLPGTANIGDVREFVGLARRASEGSPPVVVVMHAYDFGEEPAGRELSPLEEILSWVTSLDYVRVRNLAGAVPREQRS